MRESLCEPLYMTFLQSSQGDNSSLAATTLLAKRDRKRVIDDTKQFGILTFHTLVEKHKVF